MREHAPSVQRQISPSSVSGKQSSMWHDLHEVVAVPTRTPLESCVHVQPSAVLLVSSSHMSGAYDIAFTA